MASLSSKDVLHHNWVDLLTKGATYQCTSARIHPQLQGWHQGSRLALIVGSFTVVNVDSCGFARDLWHAPHRLRIFQVSRNLSRNTAT